METLYQIIASFDVFQFIVNLFPQIFNPLVHAFESIFGSLLASGRDIFMSHPGLVSGVIIFTLVYVTLTALINRRRIRATVSK